MVGGLLGRGWQGRAASSTRTEVAARHPQSLPRLRPSSPGVDSTRKITTLARECGMQLEMGDVQTESLIPASMGGPANLQQFMAELAKVRGVFRLALNGAECCHAEDYSVVD